MNRLAEDVTRRNKFSGDSSARGIVAKRKNHVPDPLGHELSHLLSAAQHGCITKALFMPLRIEIV